MPTRLGVALVETYQKIGIDLYKPYLRAAMEQDMKEIVIGRRRRDLTLRDCINNMLEIYKETEKNLDNILRIFR